MNWKYFGGKQLQSFLKEYPSICIERPSKNTMNHSYDLDRNIMFGHMASDSGSGKIGSSATFFGGIGTLQ
jgi:hypothetical protein